MILASRSYREAKTLDPETALRGVFAEATSHIAGNGALSASSRYSWYRAVWYRDNSMGVIALTEYSRFFRDRDPAEAANARKNAAKLLKFLWTTTGKYRSNMQRALEMDPNSDQFRFLKNHVPARVDKRHGGYFETVRNGSYYTDAIEHEADSWLRQHDSMPLLVTATARFVEAFGASSLGLDVLAEISRTLPVAISYMVKTYNTPSANAWELEQGRLHAYTVAANSIGLRHAKTLATSLGVKYDGTLGDLDLKADEIDIFLERTFIRNGIIFRAVDLSGNGKPYSDPVPEPDAAMMLIFNLGKPRITDRVNVESNTIAFMKSNLNGNHPMLRRWPTDVYFDGGPWYLLGLAQAAYEVRRGALGQATERISYADRRMSRSGEFVLPEQENMHVANRNEDPDKYLKANDGLPIQALRWSQWEYIRARIALEDALSSLERPS